MAIMQLIKQNSKKIERSGFSKSSQKKYSINATSVALRKMISNEDTNSNWNSYSKNFFHFFNESSSSSHHLNFTKTTITKSYTDFYYKIYDSYTGEKS